MLSLGVFTKTEAYQNTQTLGNDNKYIVFEQVSNTTQNHMSKLPI